MLFNWIGLIVCGVCVGIDYNKQQLKNNISGRVMIGLMMWNVVYLLEHYFSI